MTQLQKRITSAAILGPVALAILWIDGWPFVALTLFVGAVALWEWIAMARRARRRVLLAAIGLVYVPLAAWGFYALSAAGALPLCLVVIISASDVCAYFVGKRLGGPRLAPGVSPKKTWAGLMGAALGGALVALALGSAWCAYDMATRDPSVNSFVCSPASIAPWFALGGLVLGLLGQAGDLLVSFVKRRAGVKDTGDIIPGHGGVLDRVDSLMLPCALFAVVALFG